MRSTFLIGATFLRQQRLYVVLMVLYVAGWTGITGFAGRDFGVDDAWFVMKQMAAYAIFLGVLLAASAIHNERRSRRILSVLSKGVSRTEFLVALWGGVMSVVTIYCVSLGVLGGLAFGRILDLSTMAEMLALVFISALAMSATAIFFSTWLHPLLVMAATALVSALPGVLGFGAAWPVLRLLRTIFAPQAATSNLPWLAGATLALGSVLWMLAAGRIFRDRDITLAIE